MKHSMSFVALMATINCDSCLEISAIGGLESLLQRSGMII